MKTHLHNDKVAAVALIVLLLSGCIRRVDFSQRTTNKPNINDLSGVWVPDKATLKDMAERGRYDTTLQTKLILHASGNLELVNMPDWWENMSGESGRRLHSYSGTWEIAKSREYWEIAIFSSIMQTRLGLLGNQPPYKIGTYLGDPDSGNEMIFVKQEGQ